MVTPLSTACLCPIRVLTWKTKHSLNSGSGPVPLALAWRGRRSSGRSRSSTSVTLPWKRGGRLPRRSKETMSCSLLCRYSTEKQRRVAIPGGGATTSLRGGAEYRPASTVPTGYQPDRNKNTRDVGLTGNLDSDYVENSSTHSSVYRHYV